MTNTEVQQTLKVGSYGLLRFDPTSIRKQFHGKIKYIDSNGTIVFKDNDSKLWMISPEKIVSFHPKEMLSKPTEYKGEEIEWQGGRFYFKKSGKECDLNR